MSIILEAKALNKTFGGSGSHQNPVLKNIHLQMTQGEFVSVMGPSGSGKSTLLYTISGMDSMTSGSVNLDGQEISTLSEKQLAHLRLTKMGFIFQQIHLLKNLNIMDNIVLTAYLAKKFSRSQTNRRAKELMKKAGIVSLANNDITQASGGQLQRVAICRALINEPTILFGDEPTGALNSKAADDIMDILGSINEAGTTILLVTHDVRVAAKSERVLYMLDGAIVAEQRLGKYVKGQQNSKTREDQLSRWLQQLNF